MPAGRSRLQEEIKQRVPFESIGGEAILSILHTADVIHRRTAKAMEPFGVTPQQYNVLRILRGAGCAGLPTLEIADRMIEQAPGITRMIDRLEIKKLVVRERGCDDRRQVVCRISDEGLDLLTRMDAPLRDDARFLVGTASEEELVWLIKILDSIRGAAQQ
jgi:MarR family transcriptional regulator, organic hydroperoxide resistance regulator